MFNNVGTKEQNHCEAKKDQKLDSCRKFNNKYMKCEVSKQSLSSYISDNDDELIDVIRGLMVASINLWSMEAAPLDTREKKYKN